MTWPMDGEPRFIATEAIPLQMDGMVSGMVYAATVHDRAYGYRTVAEVVRGGNRTSAPRIESDAAAIAADLNRRHA